MGNSYFKFKQFTIHQEKAAMKVCTDSCILGAWARHYAPETILDIGAGTGLLSLMLAQKYPDACVTALEPHGLSHSEAFRNFSDTKWLKKWDLYPHTLQHFVKQTREAFDLIVCNPPFYAEMPGRIHGYRGSLQF